MQLVVLYGLKPPYLKSRKEKSFLITEAETMPKCKPGHRFVLGIKTLRWL